ncbi:ABC transporter permease [Kaistia algarum]|uniref:ABC transporter permease n=1 Tax=Kaistia algarum TaxID=2083279 RepID=UPI000CE7D646|nr:ABC transporter permease [Kaistia algarum]MCX5516553.1 ABC transporter permease [Kaistia algarum]PPE78335.1 ABC transporter permease [Kaistia algarum]
MAIRFVRSPIVSPSRALAARVAGFVLALGLGAVVLGIAGFDPLHLGTQIIVKSLGSRFGLEDLGLLFTPLLLTGLAVTVMARMGLWNIGADGQFYLGALVTTAIGLFIKGPEPFMLVLCFFAGAAGGALWILVPTLAKAYAKVDEIITTLLLNFVALLLVYYVATGPWRDRVSGTTASTGRVPYKMPDFFGSLHWGFVIALAAPILFALALRYTKWGYEVRLSGANPDAAHYAGIPVRRRLITIMLLSGAIAGIAGMLEVTGTVHRLQGGISNNYGYLGVMVAVLARGSAIGVIAGAFLMALILNAGIILQTQGLTTSAVLALTGLIMLFTAIADQFAHYRLVRPQAATG